MQFDVPPGYQLPKGYRDTIRKAAASFPLHQLTPEEVDIVTDLSVKAVEDAIDALSRTINKAPTDTQRAVVAQFAAGGLEKIFPTIADVMREKIAGYFTHNISEEKMLELMAKYGITP